MDVLLPEQLTRKQGTLRGYHDCLKAGVQLLFLVLALAMLGVVQKLAEDNGYGVIRDFVGHGIGRNLHGDPEVRKLWSCR